MICDNILSNFLIHNVYNNSQNKTIWYRTAEIACDACNSGSDNQRISDDFLLTIDVTHQITSVPHLMQGKLLERRLSRLSLMDYRSSVTLLSLCEAPAFSSAPAADSFRELLEAIEFSFPTPYILTQPYKLRNHKGQPQIKLSEENDLLNFFGEVTSYMLSVRTRSVYAVHT